jgi:flagellar basal body-associated protein FliL
MPKGPAQSTYIPPEIQRGLDQHFNKAVAPHIREYANSLNDSAHMPRGMEHTISEQMNRNMPDNLKPYAEAYVQQSYGAHSPSVSPTRSMPPPIPDQLNRSHSMPFGEQHNVELNTLPVAAQTLFERPEGSSTVVSPNGPQQQATPPIDSNDPYSFIMNQGANHGNKGPGVPSLPGLPPMASRLLLVGGGLLILIIIIVIFKSLLAGSGKSTGLVSVAQDQTAMLSIINGITQTSQSQLNTANQNIVSTMQVSLESSQQQLETYLSSNHMKVSTKTLALKESTATTTSLANAESAGDFDITLDQILKSQLDTYQSDLSLAYRQVKGPKGKALLTSDYNQSKLMLSQINNPNGI